MAGTTTGTALLALGGAITAATTSLAAAAAALLHLLLLLLGQRLGLLQPLHQEEQFAPIGGAGNPQRLVVQHLQRQQIVGTDDARRAEVGHDGGREADALEPLGDDAHFGIVWLTKNK